MYRSYRSSCRADTLCPARIHGKAHTCWLWKCKAWTSSMLCRPRGLRAGSRTERTGRTTTTAIAAGAAASLLLPARTSAETYIASSDPRPFFFSPFVDAAGIFRKVLTRSCGGLPSFVVACPVCSRDISSDFGSVMGSMSCLVLFSTWVMTPPFEISRRDDRLI